jgi:hypothetical protein
VIVIHSIKDLDPDLDQDQVIEEGKDLNLPNLIEEDLNLLKVIEDQDRHIIIKEDLGIMTHPDQMIGIGNITVQRNLIK